MWFNKNGAICKWGAKSMDKPSTQRNAAKVGRVNPSQCELHMNLYTRKTPENRTSSIRSI